MSACVVSLGERGWAECCVYTTFTLAPASAAATASAEEPAAATKTAPLRRFAYDILAVRDSCVLLKC